MPQAYSREEDPHDAAGGPAAIWKGNIGASVSNSRPSRLNEFRRDYGQPRVTNAATERVNGERRPTPAPTCPVRQTVGRTGTSETLMLRATALARRREPRGGPVRAALLTPVLQVGGAEQWLLSLVKRCDRERLRWTGIALTGDAPVDGDFCREVAAHVPVHGAGDVDGACVVRSATAREALLAAAKDADVLVTWGLGDLGDLLDTLDIPIVYVSHGSGDWSANCARRVENTPVYLAAVSEASRGVFSPAMRNRVRVICNGIEIDRCTPTRSRAEVRAAWGFNDNHRLVAYAGRYSEEKNPAAAALAVTRLPEHYYAVYAGSGRHEASVRALVPNIAGTRARFVEPERRIGNLLQAFDVLVMASESEGFSLLLAEAWYCGLPVVSTRVGAVPELEETFGPLVSGVPVRPTAEELAAAVEEALASQFREEVVPRARALVEQRFTARRMAEQWTDYLLEVCAASRQV